MADVLLIYPPYPWQMKSPPLGLAYIASVLEADGRSVAICDMNPLRLGWDDLEEEIKRHKPRLVGVSFMTPQVRLAEQVARLAKEVDESIAVVVGGPHASALPAEMLEQRAIDFVVVGEGEMAMKELVAALFHKTDFRSIGSLAFRESGHVVINPRQPPIVNLDDLPFPAWHLLPLDKYSVRGYGGDISKPTFAILSSRGCPNQCIFCDSHTIFQRRFRGRSAQHIFAEMVYLWRKYGATQFDFVDDTITINKKRLAELCRLIIDSDMGARWMCNARVNTVDYQLLKLMKEAGCVRVDFGVESGDPKVLKAIKKKITLEQVRNAHRWAREVGISTSSFFMVGNLEEDWASVRKTVELAAELKSDFPSVGIATPYPGSELYQIARKNGWILVEEWSKYTPTAYQDKDYVPPMRTDKMSAADILKAYYFVNSRFLKQKYQARYGRWFWLNPLFYRHTVLDNIGDLSRLTGVAWKLARSLLSH